MAVTAGAGRELGGEARRAAEPAGQRRKVERSLAGLKLRVSEAVRSEDFDCPRPPDIAMRVLKLSNSGDVSLEDVSQVVELDPFLAGQIVGLANSVVYGGKCEIRTIHRAIAQIGLRATRDLVFAIAVRGRVFRNPRYTAQMKDLWTHAVGCARVAEFVSEWTGYDADYAFLGGLMHDMGKPVVLAVITDLLRRGIEVEVPGLDTIVEVMEALHVEVGALVASRWELPEEIISAIRWHHFLDGAVEHPRLARLVAASDHICHHLGIGCLAEKIDPSRLQVFADLGLGPDLAEQMVRDVGQRTLDPDFLPI